jgi:hypothetical protein
MAVRLLALLTGRTSIPRNIIFFKCLRFCSRLSKPQGLVRQEGLGKFKISPHRVSKPRPSGLQPSALTTKLPRAQIQYQFQFLIKIMISTC